MDFAAREALRQAAGADNFRDATRDRLLYASDATRDLYPPQAVVRAVDEAQVCRVLAACTRHRLPVVPRGGTGSGLTGGALAVAGGVVLDPAGLNRILSLNVADQTAVVQPGVVTADLQAAAEKAGLFYPPDPASAGFSTIGGNVAENAGGLRAVKVRRHARIRPGTQGRAHGRVDAQNRRGHAEVRGGLRPDPAPGGQRGHAGGDPGDYPTPAANPARGQGHPP